jgi:hypothetical protein
MVSWLVVMLVLVVGGGLIVAVALAVVLASTRRSDDYRSDNPNLRPCPDCGRLISVRASHCPHCGGPVKAA